MNKSHSFFMLREKLTMAQVFSFTGAVCLFILLRWNSFAVPFERDEGEYAYSAWLMRQNEMPYENAFVQKPPMIIYTYMLGQAVSEDSTIPPRIFSAISVLLTIIASGVLIARERGNFAGLTALWLMTPMLNLPALAPFAANTETFMIFPMILVLLLYQWKKGSAPGWILYLAGSLAAIACLFKPIAVPIFLFMFIVWLYETRKHDPSIAVLAKNVMMILSGGIATSVLFLFPFLAHDGGKSLWECVVQYNFFYATFEDTGASPFFYHLELMGKHWWPVLLLAGWYVMKRPREWWYYFCLTIVSILTIYSTAMSHYYLMIIPFLAIIAAFSLDTFFLQYKKMFGQGGGVKKMFVLSGLTILLCLPNLDIVFASPSQLMRTVYGEYNPFLEAGVAAKKVAELTKPTDRVFVAGSEPEVLYYAQRKSSSRFVIVYPLMIPTPIALSYQEEAIRSLQQNEPEVIVFARATSSWLPHKKSPPIFLNYVNRLMKTGYTLVGGTHSISKEWVDAPDEQTSGQCSMLVYKKKTPDSTKND